jgi:hypothetical protein
MDELRRAATETSAPEPFVDDDDLEIIGEAAAGGAVGGGGGGGGGGRDDDGHALCVVMQTSDGKKYDFTCFDGQTFARILTDWLATEDGAKAKSKLGNPPVVKFDGDVVDIRVKRPKDYDMEDDDVVDLS